MLGTDHILIGTDMIFVYIFESFLLPASIVQKIQNYYPIFRYLTIMTDYVDYKYRSWSNVKRTLSWTSGLH